MKPHEEWLFKADHDLKSAEFLLSSEDPLYDIAVYHTQQCAEKLLKAYMAFRETSINKTHNLKMLVENCINLDERFEAIYDDCIYLNPFATLYRYPDGNLMPEKESVIKALTVSKKINKFVRDLIHQSSS